eukprot:1396091-Alexandrium_andersonii.AAC.1
MASAGFPTPQVAHPPWAWHLRCSQPPGWPAHCGHGISGVPSPQGGPPAVGMASLGFPTPQVACPLWAWHLRGSPPRWPAHRGHGVSGVPNPPGGPPTVSTHVLHSIVLECCCLVSGCLRAVAWIQPD